MTARLDCVGTPARLIGRSEATLSPLANSSRHLNAAVAPLDDSPALERALDGCQVLVNCAPVEATGERLVRAALDAGIHYVDAAAEQPHIRSLFDNYDDEATQCDVAVVPALGFDYAIGDCLAHLASLPHQPAETVVIAYAIEGTGPGDNASAAATPGGKEVVYRDGRWRSVPWEIDRGWFEFPDPVGVRQMSRYASGEVITVPRHVKTRSVTTLITAASLCPYPRLLPVFPVIRPIVSLVRRTPARALFGMVARAFGKSPSSTRPSNPTRSNHFMIAAEVRTESGSVKRTVAVGPMHNVSAAILAQGALWLAAGSVVAGVHSPATAFEPHALLDALVTEGVTWREM